MTLSININDPIGNNGISSYKPEQLTQIDLSDYQISFEQFDTIPLSESKRRLQDFRDIFNSKTMTVEFDKFLSNVFMQLDPEKFNKLMKELLTKAENKLKQPDANEDKIYEEMYQELFNRVGEAKVSGFLGAVRAQLRALNVIKETLVDQMHKLMGGGKVKIDNYLEYGYPGRLIKQIHRQGNITLTGKKFVVNDTPRKTDYIEAGFPLPYNKFIEMKNYDPLPDTVEKNSLDMIMMPIGLHHTPNDKLDGLLKSFNEKMRAGGSFVLRDHDAKEGSDLDKLANVVHSVFNAATGVKWEEEKTELRNFKDLTSWVKMVESYGFKCVSDTPEFTRDPKRPKIEDPTYNGLLRFVKVANSDGSTLSADEELAGVDNRYKMSKEGYQRPQCQTYLTSIEWHLVHIADEYQKALKGNRVETFPFFKHIKTLWKDVFFKSCKEGIAADGVLNTLTSDYMQMNVFMLGTTTIEFLMKGMMYLPLALRCGKVDDQSLSTVRTMQRISKQYAEFLPHTPFYDFDYFTPVKRMWKAFRNRESGHFLMNLYIATITTVEYIVKGILSYPLYKMYHGVETGKINLVVEDTKKAIKDNTKKDIKVVERTDTTNKLTVVETPRYRPLRDFVCDLADQDIKVASIAGQKKVQIKVDVPNDGTDISSGIQGCEVLGAIPIHSEPKHRYVRLDVEVSELTNVIKKLGRNAIVTIHDF